jgi:hypothetical protein
MIGTAFSFGGLACKTKRRDAARGSGAFRKEARTSFNASVEFALDFLWAIKALKMLHMDVSEARVVKK